MKPKTELPTEVLEQMQREGWASIESQKQYWKDKEAVMDNATNETRQDYRLGQLINVEWYNPKTKRNEWREAMFLHYHDAEDRPWRAEIEIEKRRVLGIAPECIKPRQIERTWTDERAESYIDSACPQREQSTTADPKPETEDLSRTEATCDWYDQRDVDRGDLRDDGRNPDGTGLSYGERNT